MRRILAVLLATLVAWLGFGAPTIAAVEAAPAPATVYAYDSHHHTAVATRTTKERGPPASYDLIATNGAVDHGSHGAAARPSDATTLATYDYDDPALIARTHSAAGTTTEPAQRLDGELRPFQRRQVAANAGGRVAPDLLRVGELKLPGVPKGAVGVPTQAGKGLEYAIPRGTPEISEKVASVRIMDPVTSGKYQYPNGYAVYMNGSGQTINPLTGQTIARTDPYAHIPLP